MSVPSNNSLCVIIQVSVLCPVTHAQRLNVQQLKSGQMGPELNVIKQICLCHNNIWEACRNGGIVIIICHSRLPLVSLLSPSLPPFLPPSSPLLCWVLITVRSGAGMSITSPDVRIARNAFVSHFIMFLACLCLYGLNSITNLITFKSMYQTTTKAGYYCVITVYSKSVVSVFKTHTFMYTCMYFYNYFAKTHTFLFLEKH